MDEERKRKIKVFGELAEKGVEVRYNPHLDVLYSDLNNTLSDDGLDMLTLECLDKRIAEQAKRISERGLSERERVIETAKLVRGWTSYALGQAGIMAADSTEVPPYMAEQLRMLNPTKLTIFTHLPEQVAKSYIGQKIRPLYGEDEKETGSYIQYYSTLLEEVGGLLTGIIEWIPDKVFREDIYRNSVIR